MFIDHLNDCEKQALMDLMMHLARINNKFKKKEASHLLAISKKYDLEMKFDLDIPLEDLCAGVKHIQARVIIIGELIWAARIDNKFCTKEEDFIHEVMKHFGMSESKFKEINQWVEKGLAWQESGKRIIDDLETV